MHAKIETTPVWAGDGIKESVLIAALRAHHYEVLPDTVLDLQLLRKLRQPDHVVQQNRS
jgi:hypothetical protein